MGGTVGADQTTRPATIPPRSRVVTALGWLSLILLVLTVYGAFFAAPVEVVQGIHQRIFYIHVPIAWIAFLAFFVVFVASAAYLRTRRRSWDRLARASAEVGVVFTTLVLITGALWGRPIWGTWWTWDPKLTTTLVLWFIYVGYLMLRTYVAEPERAARSCAVVGLVGFVDVPIVYFSTTWWRALHPGPMIVRSDGPALPPGMLWVFFLSLIAFNALYVYLVAQRVRVEQLKEMLLDRLDRLATDGPEHRPVPAGLTGAGETWTAPHQATTVPEVAPGPQLREEREGVS